MDNYTNIKENLLKYGFEEDEENSFSFENISYNTMNINGIVTKNEIKTVIKVKYIGIGGNMEDNNCSDDMFFFDIFQNYSHVITVGVYSFKDLAEILNIKNN